MSPHLDQLLADDYVGAVEALDLAVLRARRAECKAVETGLSYLRRLVQGRLDVVAAEVARRAAGGDADDLAELIARLPDLLAGSTRSEGSGRLPDTLGTGEVDQTLSDELDAILSHRHLSDVSEVADADLEAARGELAAFEEKVSALRRAMFDRIDAFEGELTRRYRTGEASVDSLLNP